MYKLNIYHDTDAENPADYSGWKPISFGRRHYNYQNPADFIAKIDCYGEPIPANIGLRRKLEVGTTFWLRYFEHGNCLWTLKGEIPPGTDCPFDGVPIAGILLWRDNIKDLPKTFDERENSARNFLKEYTAWCNGEIYWYDLIDKDDESVDTCGGFYSIEDIRDSVSEIVGDSRVEEVYH